ncbi:MAG: Crp/Fnr family transcriptional regulator [Desulfovibrionaceae bacterium]
MQENITYAKGELVCREGEVIDRAYVVKRGAVNAFKVVRNRRLHLARFGPGQVLGEGALLPGSLMAVSMEAADDTELMPVDLGVLQALLAKSPNPVQRIVDALIHRQRDLLEFLATQPTDTMFHSVSQILWLMHQAKSVGEERPALSRNELVGTVQAVARVAAVEVDYVLNELERQGMLVSKEVMGEKTVENFWGEVDKRIPIVADHTYTLTAPDDFLAKAATAADAYRSEIAPPFVGDLESMDLEALAQAEGLDPQRLLRAVCVGDLPLALVCLRRQAVQEWLGAGGREKVAAP